MFGIGSGEMLLIFLAILLLFGAKKLPELAKGLGKGMKEFKKAQSELDDESGKSGDETPKKDK
jgi:sec-independent protein translocase protein TatA